MSFFKMKTEENDIVEVFVEDELVDFFVNEEMESPVLCMSIDDAYQFIAGIQKALEEK